MIDVIYFLKTWEHVRLTLFVLFLAIFVAVPLGAILARSRFEKLSVLIVRLATLVQTIPGLAMLSLIVVLLAGLRSVVVLPITGVIPALIALYAYAILPILTSTYTGLKQVNPAMIEVAQGMGMTGRQILLWVQLPSSIPVIISGIRISAVWTLSMATLTSLVGSGGLGDLIMQGLRSMQWNLVIGGTISLSCLAIVLEWSFSKMEKWLTLSPKEVS